GRLWIATFKDGVNCIPNPQSENPVFLNRNNGLPYPKDKGLKCRQIHILPNDVMLVATTGGLFVADVSVDDVRRIEFKCHVKDVNRANSLNNNATMYVTEDARHRLYVCTESGGLNQIVSDNLLADELNFRHFDTSVGLPSDVALSAVPMSDSLLIVSNNQLILLNPDDASPMNNTAFFWKDKLRFSDAPPTQLPDGRWIFGLQNGAFTIHPDDLKKSHYVPNLTLTGISVGNGTIDHAVCWQDTLVLEPQNRSFTVYFATLSYSGNENVYYAFQMGDDNRQWNNIGKNHSATFLDLRPGVYQLKIRSTNNDGIWVDNVRTLTVVVKPTFWETRWAQILYVLLLATVVWGILRTRRYIVTLKRRQQELHEAYLALMNKRDVHSEVPLEVKAQPATPKIKPEDEAFMQRAMRFIEEHIGDSDINIGDMAEATLTSRSGLNRKMKSLLGVTPLDFIREARIRKACQLLKEGKSVNDVAYDCGFSDPKYFAKCFKADIGMTPTEYRNQH
ncbi:MAG: helix-turn-helix domain-containing protein, partial [Prevotella sp.]